MVFQEGYTALISLAPRFQIFFYWIINLSLEFEFFLKDFNSNIYVLMSRRNASYSFCTNSNFMFTLKNPESIEICPTFSMYQEAVLSLTADHVV